MGTIRKGVLGGSSSKVGSSAIESKWDDIQMRILRIHDFVK